MMMLCSSLFTNFFLPFPHFFLGEWVMKLPKFMLTHPQEDGKPLLYHVFASLYAASGVAFRPTKAEKGPAVMMTDFDPNVHMQVIYSILPPTHSFFCFFFFKLTFFFIPHAGNFGKLPT